MIKIQCCYLGICLLDAHVLCFLIFVFKVDLWLSKVCVFLCKQLSRNMRVSSSWLLWVPTIPLFWISLPYFCRVLQQSLLFCPHRWATKYFNYKVPWLLYTKYSEDIDLHLYGVLMNTTSPAVISGYSSQLKYTTYLPLWPSLLKYWN